MQAKLLAQRGDFENAERLAREAIELAARTDFLEVHARALDDFAEVLRLAGRPQESLAELEHAIRLHEQKGNVVSAATTRALVEDLSRTVPLPPLTSFTADSEGQEKLRRNPSLRRRSRLAPFAPDRRQSGYSSFRQARGSAGWAFGVRSSRKL